MRTIILGAAALAALFSLPSCVTADPCTANWFERQADLIQRDFVRRNRGEVRRMRALQSQLQDGMDGGVDVFAMLALASAKKDVTALVADFREVVVPEARQIAATCELDQGYDVIVTAFLAENGVDARLVETLGLLGAFEGTPGITQALSPAPFPSEPLSSEPGGSAPF